MKILGLSSNYHDASAALVVDGVVICSAAEERFSYEKHDPSFPHHSIAFCLKQAGISSQELDYVVYHEDPITKQTRALSSAFKNFPFSLYAFTKSSRDMISHGFWIRNDVSKALDIDPEKVIFGPHHLSHAAHAFFTGPFEEAAIVTIDAVGEWSTACIFHGKKGPDGFTIEPVDLTPFPHSLGLVYSAFTGFLGFKVNDGECSTMALAAFGNPTYEKQIREIIKINPDNSFEIDLSYFDFSSNERLPLTEKFIRLFGEPRSIDTPIQFSTLETKAITDPEQIRFANIAASIQLVLESAVVAYATRARALVPSPNLCYAGGVALNCVSNAKLVESRVFENVYIPPDPGDGGGAMGAALYLSMLKDSSKLRPQTVSPYLGRQANGDSSFIEMVSSLDANALSIARIGGLPRKRTTFFKTERIESQEALFEKVATALFENKLVGWVQGRFENGPRALGNRSILCRPDSVETAARLSKHVKLRAPFRPYACAILDSHAHEYLRLDVRKGEPSLARWMQSSFEVRESHRERLRAAIHIDGSTRAQILYRNENLKFYELIKAYLNVSKTAAILNTSFNIQGLPIVANEYDALMAMVTTDLDLLVVDNVLITKQYKENA